MLNFSRMGRRTFPYDWRLQRAYARALTQLHQLNAIFAIFGASDRDKSLDSKGRGLRKRLWCRPSALRGRGRSANLRHVFALQRFAARTARTIGHGRLSKIGAFMMAAWFNGRCCILERSTTIRKPRGARRSRSSMKAPGNPNRSRCFPRIVLRRSSIAMWCRFG